MISASFQNLTLSQPNSSEHPKLSQKLPWRIDPSWRQRRDFPSLSYFFHMEF